MDGARIKPKIIRSYPLNSCSLTRCYFIECYDMEHTLKNGTTLLENIATTVIPLCKNTMYDNDAYWCALGIKEANSCTEFSSANISEADKRWIREAVKKVSGLVEIKRVE